MEENVVDEHDEFPGFQTCNIPKDEFAIVKRPLTRLQRRAPRPLQLNNPTSSSSISINSTLDYKESSKSTNYQCKINSLSKSNSQISDSDMVLPLLDLLPSADKHFKEAILSMCPLPTFEKACYMLYKYIHGHKKDPARPIRTDPPTPKKDCCCSRNS